MEDKYEAAKLKERYLAYLIDLILILFLSSILASAIGAKPVVSKICIYYQYGVHKIMGELSSNSGIRFIISYFIISLSYFFYEGYFGYSLGKLIFKMNTAIIAGRKNLLSCIYRSLIKSIPPIAIIDALFAFKKRLKQTLSERKLGFIMVRKKDIKITYVNYLLFAIVFYYLPLLSLVIIAYFFPWSQTIPPSAPGTMKNLKPSEGQLNLIFMNNFSIDYQYYILGGLILLFSSIIQVFGGALIPGKAMGDALLTYPSFVIYGVFPHFFIETMGYVFGIMSGAYTTSMLVSLTEGYFERKEVTYVGNTILWYLKRVVIFAMISFLLLVIAAYVETYVTSYLLSHFY